MSSFLLFYFFYIFGEVGFAMENTFSEMRAANYSLQIALAVPVQYVELLMLLVEVLAW